MVEGGPTLSEKRTDEEPKDIWLSPGVLVEEEPDIKRSLTDDYNGVRIPFNFLSYLLTAELKARAQGVNVNVATSGLGHIFEKYDFDTAKGLMEGNGTDEQKAFLEKIMKLEKVRNAVAKAVAEVLSFEQKGQVIGVAGEAVDNAGFRSAILENLEQLRSVSSGIVSFFGTRRAFDEMITRKALPRRLRKGIDSGDQTGTDFASHLYPLVEGAVAKHLIVNKGGRYTVFKGSDLVNVEVSTEKVKKFSVNECLREAICGGFDTMEPGSGALLMQNWDIDSDLDGFAFYPNSKGNGEACDPYYFPQTAVSEDEMPVPLRVPAVPWESSWIGKNMVSSELGGIAKGPPAYIVMKGVNPVLRPYYGQSNFALEGSLRKSYGHRYDDFQEWIKGNNPEKLIPDDVKDYNDLVRGLCQTVAERARAILGVK